MIVQGVKELVANLKKLAKETKAEDVYVGYTMDYAVWVHEINKNYRNGKQWKFLESVVRRMNVAAIVANTYRVTKDLQKSLLVAGFKIQGASQRIVPVKTGALKASAYTAPASVAPAAAARARARGESKL